MGSTARQIEGLVGNVNLHGLQPGHRKLGSSSAPADRQFCMHHRTPACMFSSTPQLDAICIYGSRSFNCSNVRNSRSVPTASHREAALAPPSPTPGPRIRRCHPCRHTVHHLGWPSNVARVSTFGHPCHPCPLLVHAPCVAEAGSLHPGGLPSACRPWAASPAYLGPPPLAAVAREGAACRSCGPPSAAARSPPVVALSLIHI